MKRLNFTKICNPSVLYDELSESFPNIDLLETLDDQIWVTVSGDIDEVALAKVIDAHLLLTEQQPAPEFREEFALRSAALAKIQVMAGLSDAEVALLFPWQTLPVETD